MYVNIGIYFDLRFLRGRSGLECIFIFVDIRFELRVFIWVVGV